jgi:hypothetical protein
MTEPYYTALRALHMGGGWLAFAVAPVVLLARKGGHRHIMYGRCFLVAFTVGIIAGLLLAAIRSEPVIGLLLFGLVTLFFLGTGYLAPRIRRGSRMGFSLRPCSHILGALASIGMITEGLQVRNPSRPSPERPDIRSLWVSHRRGTCPLARCIRSVPLARRASHKPPRRLHGVVAFHPAAVRRGGARSCSGCRSRY